MKKLLVVIAAFAATQMSPAFAVQKDVVERARVAFSEQLELTCSSGFESEWIASNAVYQYRLNDLNVKLRVEGRDAVSAHLCALSEVAPAAAVENVRYFPTLNQEMVFVQYDLVTVDAVATRTNTLAIIEMRDDQIAKFTQLNRSTESLEVLKKSTGYFN